MPSSPIQIVLTGNPNCGKTTLFNALTGLRAKVGNYAGVTVERKEGALLGADPSHPVTVLDLPGTYSLSPQSLDEQIARDVLFHRLTEVAPPDLVVVVVDASNLQRNLYYATQVIELGHPTVLALNMVDVATENGLEIDQKGLSAALGVPVFPLVASQGEGVENFRRALREFATRPGTKTVIPREFNELPETFGREAQALERQLEILFPNRQRLAAAEALLLLSDDQVLQGHQGLYPTAVLETVTAARQRLEEAGVDWRSAAIEARYARVFAITEHVTTQTVSDEESLSDRLDRILTHRIWGLAIFVGLMALMFQGIFTLASIPMDLIEQGVEVVAARVGMVLGPGDLQDLISVGMIQGVGAVVVFLPQICLLFLFIALLEDTGYMSRAAFLMDRLMSRVGLHGKSFIPMLSSFACAIPGIMATRTIESRRDRLVTILVAPLMSCSARLPVYTVLIAACIPNTRYLGWIGLPGLTLLAMYLLGIAGALGMAWLFRRTLVKGEPPPLILELPPYKRPVLKVLVHHMWDRSKLFLRRAGTVILGINILLWFLSTYPKDPSIAERARETLAAMARDKAPAGTFQSEATASEILDRIRTLQDPKTSTAAPADLKDFLESWPGIETTSDQQVSGAELRHSFAGRVGRAIEPLIRPLGFDWKIGIGLVASFAAREVFVSTMSVVYNVGGYDESEESTTSLAETLRQQTRPDGSRIYTPLTGITLMVFYVFAMQCVSTVAVVRRETNSWRWPVFQVAYMTGLAWTLALAVHQVGRLMGLD